MAPPASPVSVTVSPQWCHEGLALPRSPPQCGSTAVGAPPRRSQPALGHSAGDCKSLSRETAWRQRCWWGHLWRHCLLKGLGHVCWVGQSGPLVQRHKMLPAVTLLSSLIYSKTGCVTRQSLRVWCFDVSQMMDSIKTYKDDFVFFFFLPLPRNVDATKCDNSDISWLEVVDCGLMCCEVKGFLDNVKQVLKTSLMSVLSQSPVL